MSEVKQPLAEGEALVIVQPGSELPTGAGQVADPALDPAIDPAPSPRPGTDLDTDTDGDDQADNADEVPLTNSDD